MNKQPIGVFDSGIGGLTIMREIRRLMPNEDIVYLADQANVPYGKRSIEQVRSLSGAIVEHLIERGAKAVVVACNTASAAALEHLRERFPDTPIVGMEPAVKPAAQITRSGNIGVLATPVTFEGGLFASVVERFAEGVAVHSATLPGLVELIETGMWAGSRVQEALLPAVRPMLAQGVDTIVLACTHYPFIIPELQALVGPAVEIIDPAPAIARQTRRVLESAGLSAGDLTPGSNLFLTTGSPDHLSDIVHRLFDEPGELHLLTWRDGRLAAPES